VARSTKHRNRPKPITTHQIAGLAGLEAVGRMRHECAVPVITAALPRRALGDGYAADAAFRATGRAASSAAEIRK